MRFEMVDDRRDELFEERIQEVGLFLVFIELPSIYQWVGQLIEGVATHYITELSIDIKLFLRFIPVWLVIQVDRQKRLL